MAYSVQVILPNREKNHLTGINKVAIISDMKSPIKYHGSVIYKITNKINGKIYIGQAQNFYLRYYEHKKTRKDGYLSRAYRKYGFENFEFVILEKLEITNLNKREEYWINYYKSYNANIGYNICRFANTTRGRKRPKEEMKGLIERNKKCTGKANPFFGKKHTPEAIEKMRLKKIGKKWTPEQRLKILAHGGGCGRPLKPVNQIDKITKEIIKRWDSLVQAGKTLNIAPSEISMVAKRTMCKNKKGNKTYFKKSAGGFIWEYA